MDIRDEIITGTFAIGEDGRKEPIDWKDYAKKLEQKLGVVTVNCTFLRMNNCKGYGSSSCYCSRGETKV